jgi:hypothetical protein
VLSKYCNIPYTLCWGSRWSDIFQVEFSVDYKAQVEGVGLDMKPNPEGTRYIVIEHDLVFFVEFEYSSLERSRSYWCKVPGVTIQL